MVLIHASKHRLFSPLHSLFAYTPRLAWLALFLLAAQYPASLSAQAVGGAQQSAWYMYFGDHPFTKNWTAHLEGQFRREGWGERGEQLLIRPAVDRKIGRGWNAMLGYGYVRNYLAEGGRFSSPIASGPQPEHRIFQELRWKHNLIGSGPKAVTLVHRMRAEQRFNGTATQGQGTVAWSYSERARYRMTAGIPFRWNTSGVRPDGATVYDEVLVNFGPHGTTRALNQNRAYGALNWGLTKSSRLEVGYLHQYTPVPSGVVDVHNHVFQVSLFSTLPLKKIFGRN